jgi:hypothetical protein
MPGGTILEGMSFAVAAGLWPSARRTAHSCTPGDKPSDDSARDDSAAGAPRPTAVRRALRAIWDSAINASSVALFGEYWDHIWPPD